MHCKLYVPGPMIVAMVCNGTGGRTQPYVQSMVLADDADDVDPVADLPPNEHPPQATLREQLPIRLNDRPAFLEMATG